MSTRIVFTDPTKVPALRIEYPGPFKQIRYEVQSSGNIRFTIVKDLNLLTYDVDFAKQVSQLRNVEIRIYETVGDQEYLIRALKANFVSYMLDERMQANGEMLREEIIIWEITLIM